MRLFPMRAPLALLAALTTLVLVGSACGDQGSSPASTDPTPKVARPGAVPAAAGSVSTGGPVTVLDDGHGAELCLGAIMDSYPPQCSGPTLVGWDWAEHTGDYDHQGGVRWGDFEIAGTFDGSLVTPTRVVPADQVDEPRAPPPDDEEFATPCPEPEGGWRVIDPALTTEASFRATMQRAEQLDGYAESWVDQSINPAWNDLEKADEEGTLNDPTLEIVNVRVTHDPEAAEKALRDGWGGSLCVSVAKHTEKALMAVRDDLNDLPGVLYTSQGRDVVDLEVIYDDGSYQRWADATYGDGLVKVYSALSDVEAG